MKHSLLAGLFLFLILGGKAVAHGQAEVSMGRFAGLALGCVHQEYPNKIAHVLSSDKDIGPPRELTPVFYGCFDWHSSVHGHWLLVRLLRLYPDAEFAGRAEVALNESFSPLRMSCQALSVAASNSFHFLSASANSCSN